MDPDEKIFTPFCFNPPTSALPSLLWDSQWDATGYDAAMILQKLMVGQRRNRATLRDGLLSLEYPGLTGSVSFRSDGTAKRTIYTLTVQGGRIVEISPSAAAIAPTE